MLSCSAACGCCKQTACGRCKESSKLVRKPIPITLSFCIDCMDGVPQTTFASLSFPGCTFMLHRCATTSSPQPCNAADFNGPWVTSGLVVGGMAVTRVLTAVTTGSCKGKSRVPRNKIEGSLRYTVSAAVDARSSFDMSVSPLAFRVSNVGREVATTISVQRRPDTQLGTYQFGQVCWGGGVRCGMQGASGPCRKAWHGPFISSPVRPDAPVCSWHY